MKGRRLRVATIDPGSAWFRAACGVHGIETMAIDGAVIVKPEEAIRETAAQVAAEAHLFVWWMFNGNTETVMRQGPTRARLTRELGRESGWVFVARTPDRSAVVPDLGEPWVFGGLWSVWSSHRPRGWDMEDSDHRDPLEEWIDLYESVVPVLSNDSERPQATTLSAVLELTGWNDRPDRWGGLESHTDPKTFDG